MIKPVYIRNSDILIGGNPVNDILILKSVNKCITDSKCIQRDRGLWKIYVNNPESRTKLLAEGSDFRNTSVSAFVTNTFSAGKSFHKRKFSKLQSRGFIFLLMIGKSIKCLKVLTFHLQAQSDMKIFVTQQPEK